MRFGSSVWFGCRLGAVLLSAAAVVSQAQGHVVMPADIAGLKTIEAPKISPDGKHVAYTVATPQPASKPSDEHIWIVDTDRAGSARLFVAGSGKDTSPEWSPDGQHLAFLSNRANPMATPGSPFSFAVAQGSYREDIPKSLIKGDTTKPEADAVQDEKTMQLWWISLSGGEAGPLTNLPGDIRSFRWSHDGKRIAFIRTDADTPEEHKRKEKKDDREIIDAEYHYDRLWVYDLESRQARLLTRMDANVDTLDWSPDDSAVVSRVSPTPRIDDYWRVSVVEIFDVATGAIKEVVEKTSGYQTPVYSPDGAMIAFSRFTEHRITDEHFVRMLATGKEIKLEGKLDGTLAEMHWLAGNRLLVNAYVHAHTEAHLLDLPSMAVTAVAGLPLTALDLDASKDGAVISYLGETPKQPIEVSVVRDGKAVVLTDTNPQTKEWALGEQQEVSWKSPKDHHTIYGVLTLPPGYEKGKRYKTAIHLHGGPEESFTVGFSANWYNYALLLASQGYVVLQPNYRGSSGQEIAFTEGNYRDWGQNDFTDMMAGTDWVIHEGYADADRMVIAGWSYGGFMTSWAVGHTDRFKAAMAGAAVTDIYTMAITTDIAPSYLDSYMGKYSESVMELDKHSPVRFAANCHTPVLVLHGGADVRVPLGQGQEFYHALRFNGREAEMVVYPREPHIFHEQEHQIDSLTRELDWFAKHLPAGQ